MLARFEDEQAVLFLETDDETVGDLVVAVDDLPVDARHQDAVLTVSVDTGELVDVEYEPTEIGTRTTAAEDRFDRLSQRPHNKSDESAAPDGSA